MKKIIMTLVKDSKADYIYDHLSRVGTGQSGREFEINSEHNKQKWKFTAIGGVGVSGW